MPKPLCGVVDDLRQDQKLTAASSTDMHTKPGEGANDA